MGTNAVGSRSINIYSAENIGFHNHSPQSSMHSIIMTNVVFFYSSQKTTKKIKQVTQKVNMNFYSLCTAVKWLHMWDTDHVVLENGM